MTSAKKDPQDAGVGFGPEPEGSRREPLSYIRLSVNGHAHNNYKQHPFWLESARGTTPTAKHPRNK